MSIIGCWRQVSTSKISLVNCAKGLFGLCQSAETKTLISAAIIRLHDCTVVLLFYYRIKQWRHMPDTDCLDAIEAGVRKKALAVPEFPQMKVWFGKMYKWKILRYIFSNMLKLWILMDGGRIFIEVIWHCASHILYFEIIGHAIAYHIWYWYTCIMIHCTFSVFLWLSNFNLFHVINLIARKIIHSQIVSYPFAKNSHTSKMIHLWQTDPCYVKRF